MGAGQAAVIILGKELRAEWRTRELLNTTIVFVLIVIVLFSFSFDPTAAESRRFSPGLLWLAFLFAASLMLQPCFVREQANDTLAALRLAPVDPFAIVAGKVAANFLFLLLAELLMLPIFAAFYRVHLLPVIGPLALVLVLGTLGISITGTVFSAISAQARMRELLLPLLLLPVLTPVLIAAVQVTAGLLDDPPELPGQGLAVLVAFDVIFLAAAWLLSDYLLEE
jgi:heme exporter protein B